MSRMTSRVWSRCTTAFGVVVEALLWRVQRFFVSGTVGLWYNISDLSTLYQDDAGTIPVTSVGQTVGYIRDLSGHGLHATQANPTKRPVLRLNGTTGAYYLDFDGIDDFLSTASANLSSATTVSVFAGARKLSDTATGVILELSADINTNNGTFSLAKAVPGGTPNWRFASKGTTFRTAAATGFAAPHSAVLVGVGSILGDSVHLDVNGVTVASDAQDQGSAAYGTYPLYIGARGGSSLFWGGHLYELGVVGRGVTPTELNHTVRSIAAKLGVSI